MVQVMYLVESGSYSMEYIFMHGGTYAKLQKFGGIDLG